MDINYKMLYESVGVDLDKGLRPLSDMTEEEAMQIVPMKSSVYRRIRIINVTDSIIRFSFEYVSSARRREETISFSEINPIILAFLLSKNFNLFGLCESGLAINSTTLNNGKE